ncbi:glycoside hydrolase family 38 C-terminal domain-containing protein [Hominenteromicrobium sp.]|uniref:glycoside hydrolase family 38 N-terminal domain-containing protein n=1 Tax=Hominenteromicrobium sp. TaxID=3073581 RepID=UPI003AB901C7
MMTLAAKFKKLKTMVGGNREILHYEETFGMPMEEFRKVTMPNKWIRRILAELEFSLQLTASLGGKYDAQVEAALNFLQGKMEEAGVLTQKACVEGEGLLLPLQKEAKSYSLILAAHAHIDMNWMWSWHETVASTVATFQTMLKLMEEYPGFCFSQSQAAVYKIIERFAPELKPEIEKRIQEGRWEVTASAWVETDKNMPSTESLLNHMRYTKKYLHEVWHVNPDTLNIDFSPDTFGHSANLPELDALGGVKYYYHCRGLDGNEALYRWKAPSGKELLMYREQHWYNSGITPKPAIALIDVAKRSGGLKTGLVVYGVGDHGGGPTRRDLDRAQEMMTWPVFPEIRFGTFGEFFKAAEAVREQLPVVDHELNFIFPGCYTTQSRLKMANRHAEAALFDAQLWNTFAAAESSLGYNEAQYEAAWQSVLFTHFHDILTGSCVQDSREHAMGEFTNAMAAANTRTSLSMQKLAEKIDTSMFAIDAAEDDQSFGAGVGYGVEAFAGPPAPEHGAGKNRIYHLFNSTAKSRTENVELTVWDWNFDLRQIEIRDADGGALEFQLVDEALQQYWDHKYFRILVKATVPAFGYTTIRLTEKELEVYPFYLQGEIRTSKPFENLVLENENLRAEFSILDGGLLSLFDKKADAERIEPGQKGSLQYIYTERDTSSAWNIGRYERMENSFETSEIKPFAGALLSGFTMKQHFVDSCAEIKISLGKNSTALDIDLKIDWKEESRKPGAVPVLIYALPLCGADRYFYDVPGGVQYREPGGIDVPALQYGAAQYGERAVALVSDSKYGYRAHKNTLSCTLLNASNNPDPYPERGIHNIKLHVAVCDSAPEKAEQIATALNHKIAYQSGYVHGGTLKQSASFLTVESGTAVVSGVTTLDGAIAVRLYETTGKPAWVCIETMKPIEKACFCDVLGRETDGIIQIEVCRAVFTMQPYTTVMIKLQ